MHSVDVWGGTWASRTCRCSFRLTSHPVTQQRSEECPGPAGQRRVEARAPLAGRGPAWVPLTWFPPGSADDAGGRHQRRMRSRTQQHLNLYAVDGLRTLCVAKRVSERGAGAHACPRPAPRSPACPRRC